MKKLWILLILVFSALPICKAEDSVYIPQQEIKASKGKLIIDGNPYDSYTGYDFTGKGKPRYYDSMYYPYFINNPPYNTFQNYPAFYLPYVRQRGRK